MKEKEKLEKRIIKKIIKLQKKNNDDAIEGHEYILRMLKKTKSK